MAVFTVESPTGASTIGGRVVNALLAKVAARVFRELWVLPSWRNFYLPGLDQETGVIRDGEGGFTALGAKLGFVVKKRGLDLTSDDLEGIEETRDDVLVRFMKEARGVPGGEGDAGEFVVVRIKGDVQVYKKKIGLEECWRSVCKIGGSVGNVWNVLKEVACWNHVYEGYFGAELVKDFGEGRAIRKVTFDFGKLVGGVKNLLMLESVQKVEAGDGVREQYVIVYSSIDRFDEEEGTGGIIYLLGYLIEVFTCLII